MHKPPVKGVIFWEKINERQNHTRVHRVPSKKLRHT